MPLKDSCLRLRSFVDLSGWSRLSFVVRRSSLEWGPLQTYRFWTLSVTAPRADCQIILSLSVKEDRYGKGTADCLSPNSLPSHHPTLPGATRRGCPLDGSQSGVKKLDLGVAFSDGGDSGLPELGEKRDVRAPVAERPPIQPSLPHGYLGGSGELVSSKCLLIRKGSEFVEVVNPFTTWSSTFAPPCWSQEVIMRC